MKHEHDDTLQVHVWHIDIHQMESFRGVMYVNMPVPYMERLGDATSDVLELRDLMSLVHRAWGLLPVGSGLFKGIYPKPYVSTQAHVFGCGSRDGGLRQGQ